MNSYKITFKIANNPFDGVFTANDATMKFFVYKIISDVLLKNKQWTDADVCDINVTKMF